MNFLLNKIIDKLSNPRSSNSDLNLMVIFALNLLLIAKLNHSVTTLQLPCVHVVMK